MQSAVPTANVEKNRAEKTVSIPPFPLPFLREAARPFLPVGMSNAFFHGMTGGLALAERVPTYHDITALLLPGLAALGIRVELVSLPEEERPLARLLRERLRSGVPVLALAFSEEVAPDADPEMPAEVIEQERTVTRQGLVIAITGKEIVWRDGEETRRTSASEFRGIFSRALRCCWGQAKGLRRANTQAALRRWMAFSAAYPKSTFVHTAEASEFLLEIAGKRRTPVANRLRYAARHFAEGDTEAGWSRLREAVLLDLRLPAVAQRALLTPPSLPLNDVERRELIYLARAGTRDVKTLAARRLSSERQHAEVSRTLEQLAYDADAWVRAASQKE